MTGLRGTRTRHTAPAPIAAGSGGEESSENALWREDSRRLRNGLIGLLVFFCLVVALLFAVPGLRSTARRMESANLLWVAVAIAVELLSCASYVLLFEHVFARLRRRVASRLSLSELAMNSVVSAGGLGGFALGAWVLHSSGAPLRRVAERSAVMFLLTSAVNVGVVALFGVLMGFGVLSGSTNPLLTFVPAGAALLAIAATLVLPAWTHYMRRRTGEAEPTRAMVLLCTVAEGVEDVVHSI
ncbi:MAG: hypothetical protein KGJ43_09080, partial [Acidobacteriota bacterium]|nr:hypothetical protein [Acidobacteriota bacterium]